LGIADGSPHDAGGEVNWTENIALGGLAIAMKANEPTMGEANAIFWANCLVTTTDIPNGSEITVYYGEDWRGNRDYALDPDTAARTTGFIDKKRVKRPKGIDRAIRAYGLGTV
jgi:hypothetical protein